MRLTLIRGADPEPMTQQDLQDWGNSVDARSGVDGRNHGETPESVLNAGQAALDVTNARRGRS